MESSNATPTRGCIETPQTSPSGGATIDDENKKHFDTFESIFFQQGDDANVIASFASYEESDFASRAKRWLSYRTMMGISIASTTVAVIACVALWKSGGSGSAVVPVDATAGHAQAVAAAQPPAAVPAVSAPATGPAIAAAAPSAAPTEPVAAARLAVGTEQAPVAAPPVAVAVTPPAVAPAEKPTAAATAGSVPKSAAEPAAAAPSEQPTAPALAKVEQPKPEATKAEPTKPEAAKPDETPPTVAASPPNNEARERCQQSIREKRAKDIVAICSAAFEQDGSNADAAVAVAKVEFDRGRFAQAYSWSKKAIAVNPAAADAYVFAGGAEQNQGHGKAAKEAYLHYLRLAPGGRYAAEIRTIVNSL